ncbi:MAG: hypothetical protein WCP92_06560 [bacterium]
MKIKDIIDTTKNNYTINGKEYLPMYIGYTEGNMMKREKLFSKIGDTIDNLFGNNVMIAGIAKKTYTSLDMMHFLPSTLSPKE